MKRFPSRWAPHLFAVVLIFYCWNVYWGQNRWRTFFLADSNGYYAYLPATFIYHDFTFSFFEPIREKFFATHDNFDIRSSYNGRTLDKWYCGTAVSIAPFFLIGHAIASAKDAAPDGYSFWYAFAISLAAIFYCFIGLWSLQKILSRFFKRDALVFLLLTLILFATNLFYYSTSEPLMSHVYSFAFVNLFLLSIINFMENGKWRWICIAAFFLGMIVLIRPVNGLIIFIIPFLSGGKELFVKFLKSLLADWKLIVSSSFIFISVLFVQMIYYKLQVGEWLIYSYRNETFDFLHPHLREFLFSYRKGLFVYLPLLFLSLIGLIFIYRKNKWQFYSVVLFLFSLIYILSSWWIWSYGGSFGTRPIVEYLAVFAILLGYAIEGFKSPSKKIFVTLSFLCLLVYQVQNYQYRYYFIHWDRMTKERYWNVFMRLDLVAKKDNPNADLLNE